MISPAPQPEDPKNGRDPQRPSKVETEKEQSRFLRADLREQLDSDADQFTGNANVLKFHGIYQQYDRDARARERQAKTERAYSMMIRARVPAGIVTPDQWLVFDDLARTYGGESLRLTTRQAVQFHGVLKSDLGDHMRRINEALVTTLAACGDVTRNVMCCPAVSVDPARRAVQKTAADIADALLPQTTAYHDIWLDGERIELNGESPDDHNVEPLYGRVYLPRKFKVGVTLPDDNCIDVYTQDCGLIAILDENRHLRGYHLLVGGGLGMTTRKEDTFARLGSVIGRIDSDHAVDAVRIVVEIFRDFGNREDRRHARLKYLVEELGLDWFVEEFRRRATFSLHEASSLPRLEHQDHIGWTEQGDGRYTYGLFVENGRLRDGDEHRLLSGVRAVVERIRPGLRLTPHQNLLFTNLEESQRGLLLEILRQHGVPMLEEIERVRRNAMACPALPTCGLALADAERALPDVIESLIPLLEELGLDETDIGVRMTGCPNGCARPYTADIAFVGRGPGLYDVFAGGRLAGDRLVDLLAEKVEVQRILDVLRPPLTTYALQRLPNEGFGDFWQRKAGRSTPRTLLRGAEIPIDPTIDGQPLPATTEAARRD